MVPVDYDDDAPEPKKYDDSPEPKNLFLLFLCVYVYKENKDVKWVYNLIELAAFMLSKIFMLSKVFVWLENKMY